MCVCVGGGGGGGRERVLREVRAGERGAKSPHRVMGEL